MYWEDHTDLPVSIQEAIRDRFDKWGQKHYVEFAGIPDADLEEAQRMVGAHEYIAMDTSEVYCIDVDEPREYLNELLEVCPWYESVNRRMPHVLFRSTTKHPWNSCDYQGDTRVEMLCGRLTFARKDTVLHGSDLPCLDGVALSQNKLMGSLREWASQNMITRCVS